MTKWKSKALGLSFALFCTILAGSCGGAAQGSDTGSSTGSPDGGISGSDVSSSVVEKAKPDGLIVKNGKMTKGGELFYGAGINYFNMFTGIFSRRWDLSVTLSALETLKSYDCKVIRFSTLPFYANQMGYYFEVEDMYWQKLDEIVERCEELEIGLLPSLFWTFACFDYYGEAYEDALHDENSKGMTFIREYTEKFVTRYAESPAIYGWEFSNEKILSCDIPGTQGSDEYYSADGLNKVYSMFADTVRENDPYGRLISTGDTNPRASQYNQWKFGSWATDTQEQHEEIMRTINPGGIDTVSQHQYSDNGMLAPGDRTTACFGTNTWKTFYEYLIDISSSMDKACYVGEVGYGVQKELGYENVTLEAMTECYRSAADAAFETKMQLILFWNYDPLSQLPEGTLYGRGSGVEFSYNENMPWGKMVLETMKSLNEKFSTMEK